jgi:hypothetical protein
MKVQIVHHGTFLVRTDALSAVLVAITALSGTTRGVAPSRTVYFGAFGALVVADKAPVTRARCTDVIASRHPDSHRACEYENLYFVNGSFVALVPRGKSKTVLLVRLSSKHGNAFKPRIELLTPDLAEEISGEGTVTAHPGVFVFFQQLGTFNIGHAVWDGLYAAWVAYVRLGNDVNADFTLIIDQFDTKPDEQSADSIFRAFGGRNKPHRWGAVSEWKGWHRFERVVIGPGGKGQRRMTADDRLPGYEVGAVSSFRDRMYRVHGLSLTTAPRKWTERPNKDLYATIVLDKHYTESERAEIDRAVTLARRLRYNLTCVDWNEIGSKPDNFKSHLKLLQTTDIYISGPGTGMMYASFVPE